MHDQIRQLEECALGAWPATGTIYHDGWVLRFAGGYTRRANSVQPLYPAALPLDEKIAHAEGHYGRLQQPPVFKLTDAAQPAGLDAALAARGYIRSAETIVQTRALDVRGPVDAAISLSPVLTDGWLNAFCDLSEIAPARRPVIVDMLGAIIPAAAFALLRVEGQAGAVGLAVTDGDYVGLFDIVTAPTLRQRGLARRIMAALMGWAGEQGAQTAYLQVMSDNLPALNLYADLGFTEAYRYWYRVPRR